MEVFTHYFYQIHLALQEMAPDAFNVHPSHYSSVLLPKSTDLAQTESMIENNGFPCVKHLFTALMVGVFFSVLRIVCSKLIMQVSVIEIV